MTTTVKIETHGWPVEVRVFDDGIPDPKVVTIERYTKHEIAIYDTRRIMVIERTELGYKPKPLETEAQQ